MRIFFIYGMIGCVSTAIDFALFALLTRRLGLHYQFANVISVALSLLNGFLCNWHFNFKVRGKFFLRMASFYAVGMFGWLAGAIQLWLFVEIAKMDALISKLLAIAICTLVQFALNKSVTFGKRGAQ